MVRLINEFSLVCKTTEDGEKLCSCDFRVNIYGCPHSGFYVTVGKMLTVICILLMIMSGGFLVYLTKVKKQSLFLPAVKGRGRIRPRPLQSYHMIVFVYMFGETLNLLGLINEWYSDAMWAEFGNMLTNVLAASFAIFYTVSIVYSTPNVQFNKDFAPINKEKFLNTRLVDSIGIILFIQPIVTWIPVAILTGYYVEKKDFRMANIFFTVHFLFFVAWEIIYITVAAYFWYKLMIVIKGYIKVLEDRSSSVTTNSSYIESIKRGTRSITLPVMAIIGGLSTQALIFIVMVLTYRNITIYYFWWNLFYYWIQYVAFPVIALCVESTLLYFTIKHYNDPQVVNSQNSSGKLSSSHSSQTQVNSEIDMEKNNNNNNRNKTISVILCCGSGSSNSNDTFDTDTIENHQNNPPPHSTVIHCTSETVTSIEDVKDISPEETPSD